MNKHSIIKEIERMRPYLEDLLPECKLNILEPLIQNMAFIKVTLDELQEKILSGPLTYEYKQGEKKTDLGGRLKVYNDLIKSYAELTKDLVKYINECTIKPYMIH